MYPRGPLVQSVQHLLLGDELYPAQRPARGGDAKFTMSVSIVSMWLFRVILSYIFVLQFHLGLTGVWFGMFIDWICRSLCFLVRFARGKWMEHKVI